MFRATKSVEPPPGMQLNIRVVGVHWSSAYTGVVGKKVPPDAAMSHSLNRALTAQHTGACIHRRCLATASLATRSTSLLAWSPTNGLTGCVQLSDSARVAFSTTAIWGERYNCGTIETKGKRRLDGEARHRPLWHAYADAKLSTRLLLLPTRYSRR